MQNDFMKAMDFRHACKVFDDTKKIPDEEMKYILEAGHKSPSSFGMEAWKFLVISNESLKAQLKPACWNQAQIDSCSHLVIVLAGIEGVKVELGTPKKRFARRAMPEEQLDFYMDLYANHLSHTLSSDEHIYSWTARQTFIAAGNMMTAAAFIGIDSCPIEGFEKEKVEEILGIDTSKFQLSLVLPFGYRLNKQSSQLREPFDEIVEYIS